MAVKTTTANFWMLQSYICKHKKVSMKTGKDYWKESI